MPINAVTKLCYEKKTYELVMSFVTDDTVRNIQGLLTNKKNIAIKCCAFYANNALQKLYIINESHIIDIWYTQFLYFTRNALSSMSSIDKLCLK